MQCETYLMTGGALVVGRQLDVAVRCPTQAQPALLGVVPAHLELDHADASREALGHGRTEPAILLDGVALLLQPLRVAARRLRRTLGCGRHRGHPRQLRFERRTGFPLGLEPGAERGDAFLEAHGLSASEQVDDDHGTRGGDKAGREDQPPAACRAIVRELDERLHHRRVRGRRR